MAYWQGRTTEIAQLQQWLTDPNISLIGIEGIGGTGKSMLAAKIYEEIAGFPKRFWADVGSGAVFSEFVRRILSDFDCQVPEQESQLVEVLVKCLQSGQYLLIIDNLESLLQPDRTWVSQFYGEFFRAWVECGNNSTVLVTTRERPEQRGFTWLSLQGLKVEEGTALLTALGIGGDLAAFVQLVDGHPLLLRLVADLIKEEYPQDPNLERLADLGLGNLRQLLTDPKVVGQHRRETVGMVLVLDATFERLSDLQKTLLLNVSVCRGAFDRVAAEVVLTGDVQVDVETELRTLVKRSFLLETFNGQRKFEFQPVVLEYVRYKAGDQTTAHQQAIAYYRSITKEEPWQTIDDVRAYLEIFYHFYRLADYNSAFDAVWACNDFLTLRGYYTIQVDVYGQLIAVWEKIGDTENWNYRASLTSLGIAYHSLGEYQQAIQFHQQSLDIAIQIGDRFGQAASLNNLGNAYHMLGEYQQAIQFHRQSLEIKTQIDDRFGQAASLNNLGNAYHMLGEYEQAIQFHQQSLEIKTQIDDRFGQAVSLGNLGLAYDSLGEYERAIQFHQQSLEIKTQIGDRSGQAYSLGNLGAAYHSLGKYERAIQFHQQSLDIATQIGDRSGQANCWFNLGETLEKVDRQSDAMGAYRNACELYQAMGLDAKVQDCNNAIERLLQPQAPVITSRRGFWGWLSRLWRWVRSWFGR